MGRLQDIVSLCNTGVLVEYGCNCIECINRRTKVEKDRSFIEKIKTLVIHGPTVTH